MSIFKALFGTSGNSMNAVDAKARIDSKEPLVILDVRQPDEYHAGHIAGAKLIPLGDLASRMGELSSDKEILCVCRSGARSGSAAGELARAGFKVINLQGGMMGWQRAGLPVKKGK